MQPGKVNVLIGNSFGSEGKGNVSAYLAEKHQPDICISQNGPNAGHCYINEAGETKVMKMLPVSGVVSKGSWVVLGSGSVIDVERLFVEIDDNPGVANRLLISPTAPIVDQYCKDYEKEHLQYISSTFQGTGAAIGLKAMRSDKIKLAKDIPSLQRFIASDLPEQVIRWAACGHTILAEVSQGIGLSVDSSFYPFCTSRPVNVGQMFAYLDVPLSLLGDVIGISRSYQIRVGSVPAGYSGDVYEDSHEVTWEEMSEKLGRPVKELTTVTKRVRRVFTFSRIGFEMGVRRNGINVCFLSFTDYLNDTEKQQMKEYLNQDDFGFSEVYFVNGFGDFDRNIERVK
jgi:adenylosuccinate synthase